MLVSRRFLVGCLLLGPTHLVAQAPGLPVMNGGVARGFTLGGMVGFPNGAAGKGTAFGASGTLGFRRVAVGGFVSGLSGSAIDDATLFSGGGTLVVKVAGGPLVPVSVNLLAGAGYSSPATALTGGGTISQETWHVPVGLGISWTIARPVVAIKPWVSPRFDHVRVRSSIGGVQRTDTDSNFGLSGGITFGFLNGLGVDVAVDRVFAGDSKPSTIGVGLSYTIK